MATSPSGSAVKALQLEFKKMQEEPVEGFQVKLINDDNLFEWQVAIFGPPGTLYEGGYFKVCWKSFFLMFLLKLVSVNYVMIQKSEFLLVVSRLRVLAVFVYIRWEKIIVKFD